MERQASASKAAGKGRAADSAKKNDGEGKSSYFIRSKIYKFVRQGMFSFEYRSKKAIESD